jgi:hypothetical protein
MDRYEPKLNSHNNFQRRSLVTDLISIRYIVPEMNHADGRIISQICVHFMHFV